MIKRIVIMEVQAGLEATFFETFEQVKSAIRAQEGCLSLEVLQGQRHGHVTICTISLWKNEEALEQYRHSDLFKSTWSAVKPLFAHKAQAWTLNSIESIS